VAWEESLRNVAQVLQWCIESKDLNSSELDRVKLAQEFIRKMRFEFDLIRRQDAEEWFLGLIEDRKDFLTNSLESAEEVGTEEDVTFLEGKIEALQDLKQKLKGENDG